MFVQPELSGSPKWVRFASTIPDYGVIFSGGFEQAFRELNSGTWAGQGSLIDAVGSYSRRGTAARLNASAIE